MNNMFKISLLVVVLGIFLTACTGINVDKSTDVAQTQGVRTIDSQELKDLIDGTPNLVLLDVRTTNEYNTGHINGAINTPVEMLPYDIEKFTYPKDTPIAFYCRSGDRSQEAYDIFKNAGFINLYNQDGGIIGWEEQGYELI